jgi:hypothetical protein
MCVLVMPTVMILAAIAAAPRLSLRVELGQQNQEHGLSSPAEGDGRQVAETLGGSPCRRIAGPNAHYLYLKADATRVPPGCYDAYLAVDYFDDHAGLFHVEYDKVPAEGKKEKNPAYTRAEDQALLLGSGQWQRVVFHLPEARFGHGQNFQADLRLSGAGLAMRKVEVLFSRPGDYRSGGIDPLKLEKFRTRIVPGMEFDLGCDATPGEAAFAKMLGVTSVESYVTWQTVEDAAEGKWDWSRWDHQVDVLERAGLKWAPLLVAGPAYATPRWYRESGYSVPYVCLEHGEPSKIQSLWNPGFRPWIERFVKTFAERYRDRGVIELVRLGCSGVYGETLYPTGVRNTDWVYSIPGPFHNHTGWWAGDRFARANFRETFRRRYGDTGKLNRAWGTSFGSLDAVEPIIPEKCPTLRARADFVAWYVQSMTEYATFWVAVVREYFPSTPIYQSLGGSGAPIMGSDFSAQAQAFAPCGGRVRVTNEGSNYAVNFSHTREVVSSARAFGLDFGMEPAGVVSAEGNVARIYNATASGAIHLFLYKGNLLDSAAHLAAFRQYASQLQRRKPQVHVAFYLPKTSWALDPASHERSLNAVATLRERIDFELLDRTTFPTPLGQRVKVLAVTDAPYIEPAEAEVMRNWVCHGGILVARTNCGQPFFRTPEGSDAMRDALLAMPSHEERLLRPVVRGIAPRRFRLEIGGPGDATYLDGQWHNAELNGITGGNTKLPMRWTGSRAVVYLPCRPDADATLLLTATLSPFSLPGRNRVLVNGMVVGKLDRAGPHTDRFTIPKKLLAGRSVAEVVFEVRTFLPTEHGQADTRELGLAVGMVQIHSQGADNDPPAVAPLGWKLDWAHAASCTRRIGKGASLVLADVSAAAFGEAIVETLVHPEHLIPGARGVSIPLPVAEGIYATALADGVLYFNRTDQPYASGSALVPAHGIGYQKKEYSAFPEARSEAIDVFEPVLRQAPAQVPK